MFIYLVLIVKLYVYHIMDNNFKLHNKLEVNHMIYMH